MVNSEIIEYIERVPINHGRRSDIYKLSNERVLKLYLPDFPKAKIEQEFTNALLVYEQTKIATPRPIKLATEGARTGIVFQAIEGQSYMDIFQANPIKYFTQAKKLAMVQDQISVNNVSGIPTQQQSFNRLLTGSNRLTDDQKAVLLKVLSTNNANKLCHGDFHHGNVLHSLNDADYVIDWMDAFVGDPLLDIALTAVNAAVSNAPSHVPIFYRNLYETLKKVMALDARVISLHEEIDQTKIPQYLALAAGIHLARFDGENSRSHKSYFEKIMSKIK